ncbi:hypothetical protein D9M71_228960 [compost metagenome]
MQRHLWAQLIQDPLADRACGVFVITDIGHHQRADFDILARVIDFLDTRQHRLDPAGGDLAVILGRNGLQRDRENIDDRQQFIDRFLADEKGRFVQVDQASFFGQLGRVQNKLMPDHWIIVGPRQYANTVLQRGFHDLFGGVVINVLIGNVFGLRGFPVMAVATIEHTADITQRENPLTGCEVENSLGFDGLLGTMNTLAIVQCN